MLPIRQTYRGVGPFRPSAQATARDHDANPEAPASVHEHWTHEWQDQANDNWAVMQDAEDASDQPPYFCPPRLADLARWPAGSPKTANERKHLNRAEMALDPAVLTTALDEFREALKSIGLSFDFTPIHESLVSAPNMSNVGASFGEAFQALEPRRQIPRMTWIDTGIAVTRNICTTKRSVSARLDVRCDLLGRKEITARDPYTLVASRSRLDAHLLSEAATSRKSPQVSETVKLTTDLEVVLSGNTILTLQDVEISRTEGGALDLKLDACSVRADSAMNLVQHMFGPVFDDLLPTTPSRTGSDPVTL